MPCWDCAIEPLRSRPATARRRTCPRNQRSWRCRRRRLNESETDQAEIAAFHDHADKGADTDYACAKLPDAGVVVEGAGLGGHRPDKQANGDLTSDAP